MCGGTLSRNQDDNIIIQGVGTDSRTIQPGNLFVPIVGEKFDGHAFADSVIASGAGAVLWQRSSTDSRPAAHSRGGYVNGSSDACGGLFVREQRQGGGHNRQQRKNHREGHGVRTA